MNIAILNHSGFEISKQSIPECGPRDVLVKVTSCGVCSGDLFVYTQKKTLDSDKIKLGHEVSGIVEAVGRQVTDFAIGDRVTSVDGVAGYAEYFIAPDDFFAKVPASCQLDVTMGEPIACCVHAMDRVHISEETKVAIVGCGFMGLICLQIAKARGAKFITAVDLNKTRQAKALEIGADKACSPEHYADIDVKLGEYDLVIEATGVGPAINTCTNLVKQHGQLLIIGYHQSNQGNREVNMQLWNFKAIDVINGHIRRMDEKKQAMVEGIELVNQGAIDLSSFITAYSIENIENAFSALQDPKSGVIKASIKF